MYRVLITGSRGFKDTDKLADVLINIYKEHGYFTLVNGRAKDGTDQLAHEIYRYSDMYEIDFHEESHFADWRPAGRNGQVDRGAGIKRNHMMVDLGANLCIAFPTICDGLKRNCPSEPHYSHGTYDCMTYAEKKGIPVVNYGPSLTD